MFPVLDLKTLANTALTKRELAQKLGISPATLRRWMKAAGINYTRGLLSPTQQREILEVLGIDPYQNAALTRKELAQRLGISPTTLRRRMKAAGIHISRGLISPHQQREISKALGIEPAHHTHLTKKEFAQRLSTSSTTLRRWMKAAGINYTHRLLSPAQQREILEALKWRKKT